MLSRVFETCAVSGHVVSERREFIDIRTEMIAIRPLKRTTYHTFDQKTSTLMQICNIESDGQENIDNIVL